MYICWLIYFTKVYLLTINSGRIYSIDKQFLYQRLLLLTKNTKNDDYWLKHSLLLFEKKSFYEISFHQFIVRLKFKLKLWFYSYSTWIHFPAPVDILSSCQRLISIVRFFGPMIGQLSPCRSLIGRHWLVNVTLFKCHKSERI